MALLWVRWAFDLLRLKQLNEYYICIRIASIYILQTIFKQNIMMTSSFSKTLNILPILWNHRSGLCTFDRIICWLYHALYTHHTFKYMLCASLRTSDTSLNVRKQDEKSLRKTKIYSAHGCHFLDMVAPLYNRPENGEPHQ